MDHLHEHNIRRSPRFGRMQSDVGFSVAVRMQSSPGDAGFPEPDRAYAVDRALFCPHRVYLMTMSSPSIATELPKYPTFSPATRVTPYWRLTILYPEGKIKAQTIAADGLWPVTVDLGKKYYQETDSNHKNGEQNGQDHAYR